MKKIVLLTLLFITFLSVSCGPKVIEFTEEKASLDYDGDLVVLEIDGQSYRELEQSLWQVDYYADFEYIGTLTQYKMRFNIYSSPDKNAIRIIRVNRLNSVIATWRLVSENLTLPDFIADNVSQIEVAQYKGKEEILKTVNSTELIDNLMKGFYNDENSIPFEDYQEALEKGQVGAFGKITIYANEYEWLQYYSGISFIGENCYVRINDGLERYIYIPKEVLAEIFDIPLSRMNGEDYWWTQDD